MALADIRYSYIRIRVRKSASRMQLNVMQVRVLSLLITDSTYGRKKKIKTCLIGFVSACQKQFVRG